MGRKGRGVNLLPFVLAGHFIGDWIVQTDWQSANKAKPGLEGWVANLNHVVTYTITLSAFLVLGFATGSTFNWWWSPGVLLALSFVTHSFIDRRWPVRWLLEHTGSKAFAQLPCGVIAADQALHLSILCLLCGVLR
jgi:hypothetical protein